MEENEKDCVEDLLPTWVEFTRMSNEKEMLAAVTAFFGSSEATIKDFKNSFGIDVKDFPNFYLETGVTDAPTGPFLGGKVSPILVIKQSRSGKNFTAHIFKHEGLLNESFQHAWIDRIAWEKHVDDTFTEELKARAAKVREQQQKLMDKLAEQVTDDKE